MIRLIVEGEVMAEDGFRLGFIGFGIYLPRPGNVRARWVSCKVVLV